MIMHADEKQNVHTRPQQDRNLYRTQDANLGQVERTISTAAGLTLLGLGLRNRGPFGVLTAAVGGLFVWHGMKNHSWLYEAMGITGEDASSRSMPWSRNIHTRRSVTIDASAQDLYSRWRDISQLRQLFPHVQNVETIDDKTSHWVAKLGDGRTIEWDAVITEDVPGQKIGWQSTDEGSFQHEGEVTFRSAIGNRGTVVTLDMRYHVPGGAIGALWAKMIGSDPAWEANESLRRFKQLVETGEIASAISPASRGDGWNAGSMREQMFGGKTAPLEQHIEANRPQTHERHPRDESDPTRELDEVDEAARESFPASDPPSFNPGSTGSASAPGATGASGSAGVPGSSARTPGGQNR